ASMDRPASHGFPQRIEQDLARGGEVSTQHDQLRIEQVVHVGGGQPNVTAGVGQHATATRVADPCQFDDVRDRQPVTVAAPQVLGDRVRVGECVEAAAPPALADEAVLVDGRVSELPGGAVGSQV